MKIKNYRILLFMFIFCLIYLYVNTTLNAQYPDNSYYRYQYNAQNSYYKYNTPYAAPSYLYNTMYSNNYSSSAIQFYETKPNIPAPQIRDWSVHPSFGNTVYAATTEGNTLTIYGTYFSAHTHAGVNFNRTLSMDYNSMPYLQSNQTMYQNIGGQSSYISPVSYYARQVLQFSPVLHGPILNYQ